MKQAGRLTYQNQDDDTQRFHYSRAELRHLDTSRVYLYSLPSGHRRSHVETCLSLSRSNSSRRHDDDDRPILIRGIIEALSHPLPGYDAKFSAVGKWRVSAQDRRLKNGAVEEIVSFPSARQTAHELVLDVSDAGRWKRG